MIEGPRPLALNESASLEQLVDKTFMNGIEGSMFRFFPALFSENNHENLFVFVDNGRVVSHVGMAQCWASIQGCTLRVACIGAVSTFEEYRNKGLASKLFKMACEKARADGVDIMMISGGRTLYRRAGAADAGCDFIATVDRSAAKRLHGRDVSIDDVAGSGFDACAASYETRTAHFIRPRDDWKWLEQSGIACCQEADIIGVRRRNVMCAYFIMAKADKDGVASVIEFAGDETAIAAALKSLLARRGSRAVTLRLQQGDIILRALLEDAGIVLKPETTTGTLLIVNFPQLITRLRPYIEHRIGIEEAKALGFHQDGERFVFSSGDESCNFDAVEAVQAIFGHPEKRFFTGALARIFPVQTLYYGINYI